MFDFFTSFRLIAAFLVGFIVDEDFRPGDEQIKRIVDDMIDGLNNYLDNKGMQSANELIGKAIPGFVEWGELDLNYDIIAKIDEDKCIDSKHCPKCQGEYIEPEDERFIEGYTEALSIAKVKKLTLNLVEPLCRFEYIKNHLLNLQTISSASDEAIEALAKTKFNLNIGFKDDRLNSQLHRATKKP